jgi:adenylate cyclase
MDAADYERAGLYDPRAEDAAERLELLEFLDAQGVTLEAMVEADVANSLPSAAADHMGRPAEPISLREVAERAGMPLELATEAWLAIGLGPTDPDEPRFAEEDVETFASFGIASQVFTKEAILAFTRQAGSAMARMAEAGQAIYMRELQGPLTAQGARPVELARGFVAGTIASRTVPRVLRTFYRLHWTEALRRFRRARAGVAGFESVRLAVGFIDLVGYTPLAEQLEKDELTRVIADFESHAFDVVTAREGRIVKLIGDEIMFTALDAAAACDIALTLFETLGERRAVTPRGGLAVGELITRGGDHYGPIVNLASRIADLAVPDEILVTTDLRDEVVKADVPGFRFDPAGRRMLKGLDAAVEVFSLSPAG